MSQEKPSGKPEKNTMDIATSAVAQAMGRISRASSSAGPAMDQGITSLRRSEHFQIENKIYLMNQEVTNLREENLTLKNSLEEVQDQLNTHQEKLKTLEATVQLLIFQKRE